MPAELPSTEQIFTETSHLVPLVIRFITQFTSNRETNALRSHVCNKTRRLWWSPERGACLINHLRCGSRFFDCLLLYQGMMVRITICNTMIDSDWCILTIAVPVRSCSQCGPLLYRSPERLFPLRSCRT